LDQANSNQRILTHFLLIRRHGPDSSPWTIQVLATRAVSLGIGRQEYKADETEQHQTGAFSGISTLLTSTGASR
jgi:hypothetical protein